MVESKLITVKTISGDLSIMVNIFEDVWFCYQRERENKKALIGYTNSPFKGPW
jgi:hypothetical protein